MYRQEAGRRQAAAMMSQASLEDYLRSLEMEVLIAFADEFTCPRVSQLTQRTNQFNLTTKRYSEPEVTELIEADQAQVRVLRLKDRFGDTGLVGTAILKFEGQDCLIETFLLSCRVIGRGVEDVLLWDCANLARQRSCRNLIGRYVPTARNNQVESFYPDRGFEPRPAKGPAREFVLSLDSPPDCPQYFKSIASDVA
ncbi:MAG: hypothetical protein JRJ59_02465 [Deltaproteobacteria bacterium]|nr:hypothetical protein [Deltaproteobacteria bacterium]